MLDTSKLIPKRKEGARLSGKTITTIGLIKKDVVKIDSLLKEKLVLSKVRYSILKQQNERERRSNRESVLENKKNKSQDYGVNLKSNKKGKGFGGFLGGILKALLVGLGFTIAKSLPALLKIGKTIKAIATPFTIGATVLITAISRIIRAGENVLPNVRGKDFRGASGKSITDGINGLSRALIETAIVFAGGAAVGFGVSRLVRGKIYTEKQAANILETQKRELRGGKTVRAKQFNRRIRSETQRRIMVDDNFSTTPRAKTFSELAEIEVASEMVPGKSGLRIPKGMTPQQYERIYGSMMTGGSTEGAGGANTGTILPKKTPGQLEIDLQPKMRISTDPYEVAVQSNMVRVAKQARELFPKLSNKEITKVVARERAQLVNLLKLLSLSEFKSRHPDLYKNFLQARKDIANQKIDIGMEKSKLSGTGLPGSTVTSSGKVGQRVFRRADGTSTTDAYQKAQKKIFGKTFKKTGEKIGMGASKKGLSKLLFNVGGEALEQTVKQSIKASVGVIPIIGDLIGFLLDVFLFGQPVGRAAFMATGSLLGGLIGGVFGLIGGPPGAFVGSILGGIGGDLLGGAFYDLIFEGGVGAKITDNLTDAFVKKGVKAGVGMGFMRGGYVPFGGIVHAGEFVIDADSTRAIERQSPGFLMALNKAKGSQVDEVLETYMSYGNDGEGTETLIPLPFEKIVTRTVVTDTGTKDDSSSPFMDLYRRG